MLRETRQFKQPIDLAKVRNVAGNDNLAETDVFDFGTFIIARSGLNRNHSEITPEGQRAAVDDWIGKPIYYRDHETETANQIGRIYDAWTEDRPGETVTVGRGFGVITDDHRDIFTRIKNGIHREMSCAYEPVHSLCSDCRSELVNDVCPNGHADAHILDVEFKPDHVSFVGRPAVEGAGLIAAAAEEKVLRIFGVENIDEAENSIRELRRDAADGREFRAFARNEFTKWHRIANRDASSDEIESLADKLTAKEMIRLARIDKDRFHSVIPDGRQLTQHAANDDSSEDISDPIDLEDFAAAMKG